MTQIRITIRHDSSDPANDLRRAARVRQDLWAHSPVEIDPDSPIHRTHRNAERNAYFEFATDHVNEVKRVLAEQDRDLEDWVRMKVAEEPLGPACINCGNIAGPVQPAECPTCHFHDIGNCPYCNNAVPRQEYVPISGDLFTCPRCGNKVRLRFHDPMFKPNGDYYEPLVSVEPTAR